MRARAILLALPLALCAWSAAGDPYSRIWREALRLGGGSPGWLARPEVEIQTSGPEPVSALTCRYGRYTAHVQLARDGSLVVKESITIWIDSFADRQERLLHEMLHAVWMRRAIESSSFASRHPDSEVWVREMMR